MLREEIWTRLLRRETPADIWRDLKKSAGKEREPGVSQKTITRMAAMLDEELHRRKDPSGPWRFAPGNNAPVLLDTIGAVMTYTRGQVTTITEREAGWIEAIAAARPEIPPFELWRLARLYIASEARREAGDGDDQAGGLDDLDDLDALLAFAPWRSPEHRDRYEDACRAGWIAVVPRFILESLWTRQPQRAELANPEALAERLRVHTKGMQTINRALEQGGRLVVSPGQRDPALEARIERHNERVRERNAALPPDQRLREYYDEDEAP